MREKWTVGAFFSLCLLAAPASAQSVLKERAQPQSAADSPIINDSYYRLALAVAGEMSDEQNVDRMIAAFLVQMKEQPQIAALDVGYPGLIDAIGVAMRPAMLEETGRLTPRYMNELRGLYQANLTQVEARRAADFMATPAMRRYRALMISEISLSSVARDLVNDQKVSGTTIKNSLETAGIRAAAKLTPAERTAVGSFMVSPLGLKVVGLNPQKLAIDQKWSNYVSPEAKSKLERVVPNAIADFIEKTDPAAAKRIRNSIPTDAVKSAPPAAPQSQTAPPAPAA